MNTLAPVRFAAVDGKFWRIFGLSLALHAAVLAWSRGPQQVTPPVLPNIMATLRLVVSPASQPSAAATTAQPTAQPTPPAPAARPQPALPRPAHHTPLVTVPPLPAKTPARTAEIATRPPAEAISPAPATTVAIASTTPAPAPVAAGPVTAPAAAPSSAPAQSSLLAAYRQRLTQIFAGQQQYPRIAALRGWEGEVRLRLHIARKGNLLAVQLDHSSGFNVLDQHALAMLEQLASLPPLPDGLEASEIQVVVPVSYKLRKNT